MARREWEGAAAAANGEKEGRNPPRSGVGDGESEAGANGEGTEVGGNRELTLLIHLLVAFPVYILLPAGYDGL